MWSVGTKHMRAQIYTSVQAATSVQSPQYIPCRCPTPLLCLDTRRPTRIGCWKDGTHPSSADGSHVHTQTQTHLGHCFVVNFGDAGGRCEALRKPACLHVWCAAAAGAVAADCCSVRQHFVQNSVCVGCFSAWGGFEGGREAEAV